MSLQTEIPRLRSGRLRLASPVADRRHFRRFAMVVLALACGALARAQVKVGDAFPALAVPGMAMLGGGDLPATAGNVVVVDFWASWCAPCKASFPSLAKMHAEFAPRGLVIAAVSVDEKLSEATKFVRNLKPPFATLHDREQKLVQTVAVPTMPTTYVLGRDGRVRYMHQGYHGGDTDRELRKQIETLLAEGK